MTEILVLITQNWPNVGLVVALLVGVYLIARYLFAAEMRDMRRRIDYLDQQVRALRYRDLCYFEYVLYDESYHNRTALTAASMGWELEKHMSFLEFRDKWMRERGLEDQQDEIWR